MPLSLKSVGASRALWVHHPPFCAPRSRRGPATAQHSTQQAAGQTCTRRAVQLRLLGGLAAAAAAGLATSPAEASLVQFPVQQLKNTYFLVRAGESEAEAGGYVLTNPVWKTSLTCGLSQEGKRQDGAWLWPSITQNAYQTAETLASLSGVGRSRIVPEYARGVGALERQPLGEVAAALGRGDAASTDWRPPPGTDGTPPESAADVAVRVRQLLSITETQYSGESVLVIAPDSDTLSVLQSAVMGVDLQAHRRYTFSPGEVRRLELSALQRNDSPRTLPCPHPPQCL